MAAEGYPDKPKTGGAIGNLAAAGEITGVTIFHAATKQEQDRLVATGGRVLSVTAQADDIAEAQALAYQAIDRIDFPTGFCRHDIGWRALEKVT
jgi:phosphoribosylamine--glycine ligase